MNTVEAIDYELWPGAGPGPAWRLATDKIEVTVAARGAHVARVRLAGEDGWHQVSVDYPHPREIDGYHGATVGRWANRIAGSSYEWNGTEYVLAPNEGPNQLHGGPDGFDRQIWSLIETTTSNPDESSGTGGTGGTGGCGVVLGLVSPDGDQGFPGQVTATAHLEVRERTLSIRYSAVSDQPTPLNITTHLYWNLNGDSGLDGHQLQVSASSYLAVDEQNIPLPGPPRSVDSTRFDCRTPTELAAIVAGGGFDHCFVLDSPSEQGLVASLTHENGWRMRLRADQPGVQIYTGRHLRVDHSGIALEPQRLPDAPNRPDFGAAITGQFESAISFEFDEGPNQREGPSS